MKQHRDIAALSVLEEHLLPHRGVEELYLANEYAADTLEDHDVTLWRTRYSETAEAQTWPVSQKKFSKIAIRLPKSHNLFDFFLHGVSQAAKEDAEVYVYGHNDEGIKGAQKKMREFYGNCEVIGFKKRVRVIKSTLVTEGNKKSLEDFFQTNTISYNVKEYKVISLPGMFNDGKLDEASRLLLDTTLPHIKEESRLLDYGTGTGILAKIIATEKEPVTIDVLDYDALAIEAVKKNCKKEVTNVILGNSLRACGEKKYDIIISNPPIHTAKKEQFDTLHSLIQDAPNHLSRNGKLILVTQSRIKLEEYFEKAFSSWSKLQETPRFTVWQGSV